MSCIITDWTLNNGGYGQRTVRGVKKLAHRKAWEQVNGDIPDGKLIMHSCDNPACINTDHLKCGTQKENIQDMISKGRRWDNSGCNHPNTHLTIEDIASIRGMRGFYSQPQIALIFGIGQQSVSKIQTGKTHANLSLYI